MKLHKRHAIVLVPVLAALAVVSYAVAGGSSGKFDESLSGSEEPPYVSTTGNGTFEAELSNDGTSISYRLSYAGLEGSVLQAHIHVGQKLVNGGISVFLCTNLGNGPAGTQAVSGGAGNDHRNDHRGQRDRAGWTGDPGRRVRRACPGDEGGRHLRERPLVPWRRVVRSGPSCTTTKATTAS